MYKTKLHIVELESGDFHTLVKGHVAGKTIRIVLDTGASHSCMDTAYAQALLPQLQTQLHDGVTAGIGGDDFEVRIADVPEFKLGHFYLPMYENMALLDFSYINQAYLRLKQKPIQMILGNDFFVAHKAIIDYQQNILFFDK
ncbi:MAG: retropepsin-like domain-containing protein [Bacteroidales bacterium]|nr:retropepsin-like domain-containing protein [Bacteroidales bacterium]